MNKTIVIIVAVILVITIGLMAINYMPVYKSKAAMLDRPPLPQVRDSQGELIEVARGSYGWEIGNKGVMSDSSAPYELIDRTKAYKAKPGQVITYSFSYVPQKVTIRFWQNKEVVYSMFGNGTITIPAFEGDYAVEIYGEWKEGNGVFAFGLQLEKDHETASKPKPDSYKPSHKIPLVSSMSLEAIAGGLFQDYLEHYKSEDIPTGERIKDYRIEKVKFLKQYEGYFGVEVIFSVQGIGDTSMWFAGNGEDGGDDWIKNKTVYARVSIKDDIYTLESFGTSP